MFKVNDTVNYSTTGICKITEISEREIGAVTSRFYILQPVFDGNATVMVPTENELLVSRMRPVLSKAEVESLLLTVEGAEPLWYNDDRARFEEYKKALLSPDRSVILSVIKALYLHQKSQHEKGRKLKSADERALKEAERILYSEIAFVTESGIKEVADMIKEKV